MPIHDALQRRLTDWTVRFLLVGSVVLLVVGCVIAIGGE